MVILLKPMTVPGVRVVACRQSGPRGVVKAFVLHDDDHVILVDSGYDERDAHLVAAELDTLGCTPSDLTACLVTHAHRDHVGGLAALRESHTFPVLAHEKERAATREISGIDLDRTVSDGEHLPWLGGITVVHMPGHTDGSVSFYWPRKRALLAGDSLVSAGEHLMPSPSFMSVEPEQAVRSAQRLLDLDLDLDMVLVGHGEDVHTGASAPLTTMMRPRRPR